MDILVGGKNGSKRMSMDHVGTNRNNSSGNTSAETFPLVDDEAGPSRPIDDDDISSLGEGTLGMKRTELPMRRSRQTSASAAAASSSKITPSLQHKSSSGSGRNKDLIAAELSTGKQPKTTAKLAQSLAEMHKKLTDAEERNAKLTKVFKETRTMAESAIAEVKRLKSANAELTAQVEEKTQRLVLQECKFEELQERLDEATTATAGSTSPKRPGGGALGNTSTAADASSRSLMSAPAPGGGVETDLRMRIAQLETENRLLRESKNDLMELLHQREAETDYEITLPPMDENSAAGGGADSSHHSLLSRRGGRRAHVAGSSRSMDDYRVSADDNGEDKAKPNSSTRSMDDGVVAGLRSRLSKRSSAPMIAQSVASGDDLDLGGAGEGSHDGGNSTTSATKRSSMPFMAHFATAARFEDEISVSQVRLEERQ